ncbi:hypothetical protein EV175_000133 [Coemansia sp. RSA 1933]|nr:hypothetical protein EV175_000133 [Coemansia sp. RSA 1933]
MRRLLAVPAAVRRSTNTKRYTSTALHRSRSKGNDAMQQLETDSGPTLQQQGLGLLDPAVDALRQRVHSSVGVKQLVSGLRQCKFSQLIMPKDLLVRLKQKRTAQKKETRYAKVMSVDELQHYSIDSCKAFYLLATAGGMFAAATDRVTWQLVLSETGKMRPDIVEHCCRVLRLRIVADMHRALCEYAEHSADRPRLEQPLLIPEKGTTFKVAPSRLDIIRMDVARRIKLQDSLWQPPSASPFIDLSRECATSHDHITIDRIVLPAAGLHCIIRVPAAYASASTLQPSVSSETGARAVWAEMHRLAGSVGPPPEDLTDVLAERRWSAFLCTGRPHTLDTPTLGKHALGYLYGLLPHLTPKSMAITTQRGNSIPKSSGVISKKAKRRRSQEMELAIATHLKEANSPGADTLTAQTFCTDAQISYQYSLLHPGLPYTTVDGSTTKSVPVYCAASIFGPAIAATVIPWLLQLPLSSTDALQSPRYVGVVSLPCTTQLAAQLDRLLTYATRV